MSNVEHIPSLVWTRAIGIGVAHTDGPIIGITEVARISRTEELKIVPMPNSTNVALYINNEYLGYHATPDDAKAAAKTYVGDDE